MNRAAVGIRLNLRYSVLELTIGITHEKLRRAKLDTSIVTGFLES